MSKTLLLNFRKFEWLQFRMNKTKDYTIFTYYQYLLQLEKLMSFEKQNNVF